MNEHQKQRFAEALSRVAGDEEMLTMLATIAVEDAPEMLETLDQQVPEKSFGEVARTAHSLKGLLSAFETGEPVSELEPLIDSARQGDIAEVDQIYQRLKPKLQSLVSEIKMIASPA